MVSKAMEIFNDQAYARSNEYLGKLNMLEEFIGFSKGAEQEALKEEYVKLVSQYGGRTSRSWELANRLETLRDSDILVDEALNLENGIPQAQAVDTLCMEGESKSGVYNAKDIQKILGIGRNKTYELMKSNQFPVIMLGGRCLVSKTIFNEWLNRA